MRAERSATQPGSAAVVRRRQLRSPDLRATVWLLAVGLASWSVAGHASSGGDWPTWRHDANRSAATEEHLPSALGLHWTLRLPPPRPAWHVEQSKVRFDTSYCPVAAAGRLFVPSMVRDCVTAYDLATGRQLWRHYVDGPVRFAPVVHEQRVLFVSDDGYLYCVTAAEGELVWRMRGGPADRWLIGNERVISMWPARGAPVVEDGTVYFAAGIWPFMGVFVHAVNIETGQPVWTNSGTGANYTVQQHNSPAFAGIAPQGYLAVDGQALLVSGGMTVPAVFLRDSGQFRYFRPSDRDLGKDPGGYAIVTGENWYVTGRGLYRTLWDQTQESATSAQEGQPLSEISLAVGGADMTLGLAAGKLVAWEPYLQKVKVKQTDRKGATTEKEVVTLPERWRATLPTGLTRLHVRAADQLLCSDGANRVALVRLPEAPGDPCQETWTADLDGPVWDVLVADERLIIVTEPGTLFCFGDADAPPANGAIHDERVPDSASGTVAADTERRAAELLGWAMVRSGYALVQDADDELPIALADQSEYHVLVLVAEPERRARLRRELDRRGLLGTRVSVLPGRLGETVLADYLAELVVWSVDTPVAGGGVEATVDAVLQPLRPYTGTAVVPCREAERSPLVTAWRQRAGEAGLATDGQRLVVHRNGPLAGSGQWTHQNGDAANSLVSHDERVRLPLGVLWFGGPSNQEVLPRHGHGPTPQVIGGRLFIEGRNMLRATDVYTGRLLWQRDFPDVGLYHDITDHAPGAGAIGGNYASTADSVYLIWKRRCLRLDAATGATLGEFQLPPDASGAEPYWGFVAVEGDLLVAGSSPLVLLAETSLVKAGDQLYTQFGEGSQRLVVLDRFTGQERWHRDAHYNFRHNAIAIGGGRVYCLDRMTERRLARLRRRGVDPQGDFCLYGLDLETGDVVWRNTEQAFGTWLAYHAARDLLIQAGSKNRDRAPDEVGQGMAVLRADTGTVVWKHDELYGGPPMLYPDAIVTQGGAYEWETGQARQRAHPLTGESVPWQFTRNYGCNTAIGCTHLVTFRSAAAGYYDLTGDGGTGNWGGFRSSCTANLLAADGVLNAPDYTRTCTCSYQNQCSLALVTMPEVETWTFNSIKASQTRVRQLGINFGAPGDRRADDGVLWLDFPSVGGPSPNVPVEVEGSGVRYSRRHSSLVADTPVPWIMASGVQGARRVAMRLGPDAAPAEYRVRLFFAANPRGATSPVQVRVQGRALPAPLAFTAESQAASVGQVLEVHEVRVGQELTVEVELLDNGGEPLLCGIEAKLEAGAEARTDTPSEVTDQAGKETP